MKLKKKIWICLASALSIGIAGCNIFNPTESADITSSDADALTYEGYIKFRNNEYTEAQKYFSRAIEADPAHSEAYYGLIKTKMNLQDINTFELLKYVNISGDATVPFANMDDEVAKKYQNGIDTVTKYAKIFMNLDDQGKLDGAVSRKTVNSGYMILQMMQAMLTLRDATKLLPDCNMENTSGCNMSDVLNALKSNPEKAIGAFHEVFEVCASDPSTMSGVFKDYIPGFDYVADDKRDDAVGAMCKAGAASTVVSEDKNEVSKSLDIITSQTGYSNIMDDDGDGCIDEEIFDGVDNDGDGEIDEDIRDKQNDIRYDDDLCAKNALAGKTEIKDLRIVVSAAPNEKYKTLDLDMNGYTGDVDKAEWEFMFPNYADREATQNHLLWFARTIVHNPQELPYDEYLKIKREVAKDTDVNNIKYDLEYRKSVIGGCWVNYDEAKFLDWFKGRI